MNSSMVQALRDFKSLHSRDVLMRMKFSKSVMTLVLSDGLSVFSYLKYFKKNRKVHENHIVNLLFVYLHDKQQFVLLENILDRVIL